MWQQKKELQNHVCCSVFSNKEGVDFIRGIDIVIVNCNLCIY
jgi:hypothetical protein